MKGNDRGKVDYERLERVAEAETKSFLRNIQNELWNIGFNATFTLDSNSRDYSDLLVEIRGFPESIMTDFRRELRNKTLDDSLFNECVWCKP